jgi:putative endonuclease
MAFLIVGRRRNPVGHPAVHNGIAPAAARGENGAMQWLRRFSRAGRLARKAQRNRRSPQRIQQSAAVGPGVGARLRMGCMERALAGLDWLAALRGRKPETAVHLNTGMEGEDAACFHLNRQGYRVVARRWSAGNLPGDLDLIAWQGPLLCFIEVKTRSARDASPAEARIDTHKRNMLRRLARQYLRQLGAETAPAVRFDVVSVYMVPGEMVECIHFENAFGWNEWREKRA